MAYTFEVDRILPVLMVMMFLPIVAAFAAPAEPPPTEGDAGVEGFTFITG